MKAPFITLKVNDVLLYAFLLSFSGLVFLGCSSPRDVSKNSNWKHCPFDGLEFTYVKQSDTLSTSLSFNDSLISGIESDLKSFKANGKVTNKLDLSIDRFRSKSATKFVELDDKDYIIFLQSKIKSICGLYETIREGRIYKDVESRSAAVSMMNGFINDLGNYSEKKKEELKTKLNTD